MTQNGQPEPPPPQWLSTADIPLPHLLHELHLRQQQSDPSPRPACGSNKPTTTYNTPIHVFALFLILLLSTLACAFPIIIRRFPRLPVPNQLLFLSRHFGTGVLIATAFVHLLPTAYTNLTDPCLPAFWTKTYPAMPGFIAMWSVLVVVGIEMFFAGRGVGHSHGEVDFGGLRGGEVSGHEDDRRRRGRRSGEAGHMEDGRDRRISQQDDSDMQQRGYTDTDQQNLSPTWLNKPLPRSPGGREGIHTPAEDSDSDLDLDELDPHNPFTSSSVRQPLTARSSTSSNRSILRHSLDQPSASAVSEGASSPHEQRLILQCLLLEAGILFHSIFIGLALSVSTGPAFYSLLLAISFHQTFEGLALGSRIASIPTFSPSSLKPWGMAVLYGITTPIGQAMGLGLQGLYDPMSEGGLLMVGCVNAVSCGLLVYAGLVQLLAEDFLSEKSYVELRGRKRLMACGGVVGGAMLMALVGVWA
ncbi:zip family zinc transporter like protein [Zymoseptoria brevis]|uniref:Zip family zinc transporter like protein n=1 Tax=Zymoseptoria brevis TaxID=1047168 RepID=A0A0F4GPA0_9PEZI|nr:zip family zinc transporter like protein [Zymoseptoria brevis]